MYRKIIIASQISCVMKPNIRFPHEWIRDPKSTLCGFGIHRIPFPPTTSIFPFKNIVFISALISGFILFTVSCWSIVFFSFSAHPTKKISYLYKINIGESTNGKKIPHCIAKLTLCCVGYFFYLESQPNTNQQKKLYSNWKLC